MNARSFIYALVFSLIVTTPLLAARPMFTLGMVRDVDATIIVATIHDPQEIERENSRYPNGVEKGFHFTLVIDDVIRTGKLAKDVREVDVPFSPIGYARHWEFGAVPKHGQKVLVLLQKNDNGELEVVPYANAFSESPQPAYLDALRKMDAIWQIPDPQTRLHATLDATKSDNQHIRWFALEAIAGINDDTSGIDLTGSFSRNESLAMMWEFYTAPDASWEAIDVADNLFWNLYRGEGWETFEPRYSVLVGMIRRALEAKQEIHHNLFDYPVMKICFYANHTKESFELLDDIIAKGLPIYRFGTMNRYSILYQPFTTDQAQQKLNAEILKSLIGRLNDPDSSIADGAACSLGDIAKDYAMLGSIPEEIAKVIRGDLNENVHKNAKSRLAAAWRECEKIQKVKLPDDIQPLAYPWENALDKKVVAVGRMTFRDSENGRSIEIGRQRLWIKGLPDEHSDANHSGSLYRVTGRLTRCFDLNRFVYRPGEPWGEGLPVENEAELEKSRERFVLVDATWEKIEQ